MSEQHEQPPVHHPPREFSLQEAVDRAGLLRALIERAELTWKLLWDERVRIGPKLIPLAGLAYLFLPLDLLPEAAVAVLGPLILPLTALDDIGVLLVTLNLFIQAAPPDVVREYLREFGRSFSDDQRHMDDENIIDSTAEVIDE